MKKPAFYSLICLFVLVTLLLACKSTGAPPDPEILAHAGRLYDKWWTEIDIDKPTDDNPLWSLQSTNTRSGSDTWRCKECHGWDYRGKDGAYSSGSHYTGFTGIFEAGSLSREQIVGIISGDINPGHDFRVLGDEHVGHIVDFVQWGMIDNAQYIDYKSKKPIGADVEHGEELYESTCTKCHGNDGKKINFGDEEEPEYLGTLATGNPWETLHKIRFGQPGTSMPAGIVLDRSTQEAVDILGYTQNLSIE